MKHIVLILITLGMAWTLFAADADPLESYLANPNPESFREAVEALTDSLLSAVNPNTSKAYLAYIAAEESTRLLDELQREIEELAAGQRFMLGNILLELDKLEDAVEVYDSLNEDYPNWSCPWRHKGEALFKAEDFEAAVEALAEAIQTNEEHYDAYVWMAMALKELGLYEDALANLDSALKLDPNLEESEDDIISLDEVEALYQELLNLLD